MFADPNWCFQVLFADAVVVVVAVGVIDVGGVVAVAGGEVVDFVAPLPPYVLRLRVSHDLCLMHMLLRRRILCSACFAAFCQSWRVLALMSCICRLWRLRL